MHGRPRCQHQEDARLQLVQSDASNCIRTLDLHDRRLPACLFYRYQHRLVSLGRHTRHEQAVFCLDDVEVGCLRLATVADVVAVELVELDRPRRIQYYDLVYSVARLLAYTLDGRADDITRLANSHRLEPAFERPEA